MGAKKYKSYSTVLKMAAINGKEVDCNYNTKYYWYNNGKEKIIHASTNDGNLSLISILQNLNEVVKNVMDELFLIVKKLIDSSNKSKKIFKKSRGQIVHVWDLLKPYTTTENLCKWFGISESTYFNWKKRVACKFTYTKECPNIYPNQLRDWERRILEDDYFFNAKYADYSISDLLGQVMADGKVIVGESLFYEYATLIGETERRKIPRKKKNYKGLRACNAKDIIQMDKTKFVIKNTSGAWVNLIIDNRSRAILSFLICFGSHSKYTLANLKQAIAKHNLLDKPFWLVVDDGSENKGEVKLFVKQNLNIQYKIAQKNIPYSNSMIEAVIKQLKYRYLTKKEFDNIEELTEVMNKAVDVYNNRPRKVHLGKTPLQVLNGDEVNLTEYAELKEQTRKERLEENRNFNCLKHLYNLPEFNEL